MHDPLDHLEWDGDQHMTSAELEAVTAHRAVLQQHCDRFAAIAQSGRPAQIAPELAACLSEWWSALAVLTSLHEVRQAGDGRHTPAFRMWWARSMNGWHLARQSLYAALAQEAGVAIPVPEDLETGDVTFNGHAVGAFGFVFAFDNSPTEGAV